MSFAKKYGITDAQFEAMIKDGWLTCSLPFYEKVVYHYKNSHSVRKTADELGISKSEVHHIITKLKLS